MESQNNRNRRRLIAEINVTPFVDVLLVILVIFMVTAPMLNNGFDVSLPKASKNAIKDSGNNSKVVISIDQNSDIYIDNKISRKEDVGNNLKKYNKSSVQIFIKADKNVKYQNVISLMSTLNKQGFKNISLLTTIE